MVEKTNSNTNEFDEALKAKQKKQQDKKQKAEAKQIRQAELDKEPTDRITIGIPTKDRYECLAMLLWSLNEQTYKNWDLLIIDDSTNVYPLTQIPFIFPILMKMETDVQTMPRKPFMLILVQALLKMQVIKM